MEEVPAAASSSGGGGDLIHQLLSGRVPLSSSQDQPSTSSAAFVDLSSCRPVFQQQGDDEELRRELLSSETGDLLTGMANALGFGPEGESLEEEDDEELLRLTGEDDDEDSQDPDFEPEPESLDPSPKRRRSLKHEDSSQSQESSFPERRGKPRRVAGEEEAEVLGVPSQLRLGPRPLPDALASLLGQGNLSFAQGKTEEAIEMIEQVIKERPSAAAPYWSLATIYGSEGHVEKELQYSLLAAYLDPRTPADKWFKLANTCQDMEKIDAAIICYSKATKLEPIWEYFLSRLDLLGRHGFQRKFLDARLDVLKTVADLPWSPYLQFAEETIQLLKERDDQTKLVICYQSLAERQRAEGLPMEGTVLRLVQLLAQLSKHKELVQTVFSYCGLVYVDKDAETIAAELILEWLFGEGVGECPVPGAVHCPDVFLPVLPPLAVAVLCLRPGLPQLLEPLLEKMEASRGEDPDDFSSVVSALVAAGLRDRAKRFLESLFDDPQLDASAGLWLQYAEVEWSGGREEAASAAFGRVLSLAPGHVQARIRLSTLQEELGKADLALETLRQNELHVDQQKYPDERILQRECRLHHSNKNWPEFLRVSIRLLAPYYYETHSLHGESRRGVPFRLKRELGLYFRNSSMERLVKRVGKRLTELGLAAPEHRRLSVEDLHDLCFKRCEVLWSLGRYRELSLTAGLALVQPRLVKARMHSAFAPVLLLAALRLRDAKFAFYVLRDVFPQDDRPRLWNLYGLIFSLQQDVVFHRFVLRLATKQTENLALAVLSGNNSLVSGTYQHALAEYLAVLQRVPEDPLVNFLAGLTFIHIASKKDIARRHDVCLQGLAFLSRYEEMRGQSQETLYNVGRALHQTNVLFGAIHYYSGVLETDPVRARDPETGDWREMDLKPLAAHNLALIYRDSGNLLMARKLLEQYCTV